MRPKRRPGVSRPSDTAELVDGAYHEAREMEVILDNLLELARLRAERLQLEFARVDVPLIIEEVVASLPKNYRERVRTSIREGIPPADADPVRIRRVLYNLADNAGKYSPKNSEITITAAGEGDEIVIGVHDRGIGIPPGLTGDLFKPFSRLKAGRAYASGTGLGLVVCKRLCEAHGGRIWVETREGEGSSFYFTIPAAADREAEAAEE